MKSLLRNSQLVKSNETPYYINNLLILEFLVTMFLECQFQ